MTTRILVADAVATARITLKVRLASVCYDVVAASCLDEIFQLVDQQRPGLIILGSSAGDSSAIQIGTALAQDARTSNIPVVMLVPPAQRLAALKAGATATLPPEVEDHMLMARVRGILRDAEPCRPAEFGMAEAQATFSHVARPLIALIADNALRAQKWRKLLATRTNCRFEVMDPDEALGAATAGRNADVYLIAADIRGNGDGLRLLSELRSRQGSRDAGFVIAIAENAEEMAAFALDLGAGDVVPVDLGGDDGAGAVAMSLQMLLSRKTRSDQRRAEAQRNMVWAMTDPLTGLYNRRYAIPKLSEITREALLGNQGFAVIAIDLDHFKRVNDNYGHGAGDAVLTDIAGRLRDTLGSTGFAARMGGEEFLGVLPNCCDTRAAKTANTLLHVIQSRPVTLPHVKGGEICVTASIGVATVAPLQCDGWPDQVARMTLERADQALLAAKAAGRNRVICSRAETMV
ncbi:diguanylate cyclase [Paracoccus sp. JM45]|uniref:diguanylate cyclase n=1 Tax=Paracoccus sp. JM45 TaxID=2283626 RepID=UPI000E6C1C1C|nr:diguanylate cyclase [Paracoccus sp. JM45]RJE80126.1 diguanylate cyclase [Paracoccus sp. JM45]